MTCWSNFLGAPARRCLQAALHRREEIGVAVLVVAGEVALEVGDALEELGEPRGGELVGGEAVAFALEVAGVEDLLELLADGDGEHGTVEVDGLAHQGEAGAGDDAAGGAEVVDEARLAEGAVAEVA